MEFDFSHFQGCKSMEKRNVWKNICVSRLLPQFCFLKYKIQYQKQNDKYTENIASDYFI